MPEPGVGRKSDSISIGGSKSSGGQKSVGGGNANKDKEGAGFLDGIKSFGSGIARDVSMGFSANPFAGRDMQRQNLQDKGYTSAQINDYFARTDANKAKMDAAAAARDDRGGRDSNVVTGAPFINTLPQTTTPPQDTTPVYRSPFGTAPPVGTTIGRPGPEITPQMRAAALQMFESQRGAGQIPYQMLPYQQGIGSMRRQQPDSYYGMPRIQPMPQPRMPQQNVSPAFQYAAQNYQRLGGSQRLMDRPMEMMSVAERQRINEMSRAMADRQEYDMGRRMMGKGAGAVEPRGQLPRGFGGDVGGGMAGRSFGIASLRGVPSYLMG